MKREGGKRRIERGRGERKKESHRGVTLLDFVVGMIPTLAKQVPNIVEASVLTV